MKQTLNPKFSLLGLTLMSASALIAALYTSKPVPSQANSVNNAMLRVNSCGDNMNAAVVSCCLGAGPNFNCHKTEGSGTTNAIDKTHTFLVDGAGNFFQTRGNTSGSILNNGVDTTSILTMLSRKS